MYSYQSKNENSIDLLSNEKRITSHLDGFFCPYFPLKNTSVALLCKDFSKKNKKKISSSK